MELENGNGKQFQNQQRRPTLSNIGHFWAKRENINYQLVPRRDTRTGQFMWLCTYVRLVVNSDH